MHRRAAKRDANEARIVDALRACGVEVYRDLPVDLLCLTGGRVVLVEVKDEKARPRRDQPEQAAFIARHGVAVVRTVDEALQAVRTSRQRVKRPGIREGYRA